MMRVQQRSLQPPLQLAPLGLQTRPRVKLQWLPPLPTHLGSRASVGLPVSQRATSRPSPSTGQLTADFLADPGHVEQVHFLPVASQHRLKPG